jgi:hypothetical protein
MTVTFRLKRPNSCYATPAFLRIQVGGYCREPAENLAPEELKLIFKEEFLAQPGKLLAEIEEFIGKRPANYIFPRLYEATMMTPHYNELLRVHHDIEPIEKSALV